MEPTKIEFKTAKKKFKDNEGLVVLGTGGDIMQWVNDITEMLSDANISKSKDPSEVWEDMYVLETKDGHTDLFFVFKSDGSLDIGKMAIWRIRMCQEFTRMSWWSDYVDNFAKDYR